MRWWPGKPGCARPGRRGAAVSEEVRAEMVANVWKVIVSEGDTVDDGDTLVILESMKMEIPILAEVPGKVSRLSVAEGDVVQEGDLIAVID
jgi:acetyl-CoA carboxylase biotin carboxyl carrier protein